MDVVLVEMGSGVFAVKALVEDLYRIVAYVLVKKPVSPDDAPPNGRVGEETWYTVYAHNNYTTHANWVDHFPYEERDPKELRFDWLQEALDWTPPQGENKPTYKKWVHTVTVPVMYP